MSQPNTPIALELSAVTKRFGKTEIIRGVDLAVRKGERVAVIGPNGAGKSTLFKMLAGTVLPDRGTIHLRGRDITRTERYLRARMGIGIKVQNVSAYNDLTVRHNLLLPLNRKLATADEIEQAVGDLLERIHLRGSGDRLAGELSHGQKQWLSIGMTLAGQPSLMLLDEPVAGMGPEETQATVDIIRAVNAEGVTILVVEHDMEFVRKLQSHVTVLHYGRTFAQGTLAEIEAHEEVRRIYLGNRSRKRVA